MAKTAKLEMRDYDVSMSGWPRKRISALSADVAEQEYRHLLELNSRNNHNIQCVDITAQRERNNGLTDLELARKKAEKAVDAELNKAKEKAALEASTANLEQKAQSYLDAVARNRAEMEAAHGSTDAVASIAAGA